MTNEPGENAPRRNYKWPWFALAAVLLFITLAVLWVIFAAEKVGQQRGVNAPVSTGAK
jgi:hypothetical protein